MDERKDMPGQGNVPDGMPSDVPTNEEVLADLNAALGQGGASSSEDGGQSDAGSQGGVPMNSMSGDGFLNPSENISSAADEADAASSNVSDDADRTAASDPQTTDAQVANGDAPATSNAAEASADAASDQVVEAVATAAGTAAVGSAAQTPNAYGAAADASQPANPYGAADASAAGQPANPYAATYSNQPANPYGAPASDQPINPYAAPSQSANPYNTSAQPANPYAAPSDQPVNPYAAPSDQPANPYTAPGGPAAGGPVPPMGQAGAPMPPYNGAPSAPQGNGKAIAALICGLGAIIFGFVMAIIGVVLGIVAIVLAGSYIKQGGTAGTAKAGRICGIVGIVISVLMMIVALILGVTIFTAAINSATVTSLGDSDTTSSYTAESTAEPEYTAEEQEAVAALTARLDQYKSASDEAVDEVATLANAGFEEQTGVSMEDCGVDPKEYARAVLNGFDYKISLVSAYDGTTEGFVSADVTCRNAYNVIDELNAKTAAYAETDEYASSTADEDRAKMGQFLMEAAQEAELEPDNYFSVNTVLKDGTWVLDEDSWDEEIDYLFGLV